jgi:class 3 adenylate cyclase/predicted ATPase
LISVWARHLITLSVEEHMQCANCGADIGFGKKFCTQCGCSAPQVCPSCGGRNDANAKFCGDCGAELSPVGATSTVAVGAYQTPAERRQVAVLFCDLVGFTALSARLDPEDLREVILAYQKCAAEIVCRFGGFVAQYLGDGVLVYFGYPQAHEDDAERAVRAGLELVAAVSGIRTHALLQTRVGIATGLVVVGDLLGAGPAHERGIVGETPNLAARLQGVAEPNTVVIAESTRRLVGNLFEVQDLGTRDLKGIAGSVRAWTVLRASSVESRFEALHTGALTALVGREEELELLLRRWSRAKTGEGQVVLLSGEAGIGKSRLTAALLERLAAEPHARLRYFCSPQHTDSALYPIIGQMERAAGMVHDDSPQTRLNKLGSLLAQSSSCIEDAALFADLLSLRNDGRYPALDLDPQQRRRRTLGAFISRIEALARQGPVLMAFEDAHWTDPTSLELIGWAVDRIARLRVLLIVTFRPEFAPPWIGQPHVTSLTIRRLVAREVGAMIDCIVGSKKLPASIPDDIIERTDGVPLFVEEMTKAVLEAEDEGAARSVAASVVSSTDAIPASLHASLMARLDRLGRAKEVAQVGAAIGREFSHVLLAAAAGRPEAELSSSLDSLVAAGLLFKHGESPDAIYLFKHALVRDAAYGTLLREPRRSLHARVAEALESQFAEIIESQPELLAHHCTAAGLVEKAAKLWGKAGQRSLTRSALVEATAQLTRAAAQLAALPVSLELRPEQIKVQLALANALMHTRGYAAPETKASFDQARALIERAEADGDSPDDPLLEFSALYGSWIASYVAFNGDLMRDLAALFLFLSEKQADAAPLMVGHRLMGMSLFCTGDIVQGCTQFDHAISLYDPVEHRPLVTRFGVDTAVSVLSYRPMALWLLGHPSAALADADRAVKYAREIGHVTTLIYALSHTSLTQIQCGNYATANGLLDETIALADESSAMFWKAYGKMHQGCVLALTGKASDAIDVLTTGITEWRSTGSTTWIPLFLSFLARAHVDVGQFDEGWRCINEAMTAVETTKEKWCEAEVHRICGQMALKSPEPDVVNAETHFEHALAVARQQGARSWELRAAMSMARLWRDQGKADEAQNLLAPIYSWFTEGHNTLDLKETKVLLNGIAS